MLSKTEKVLVDGALSRYADARIPVHLRNKVRLTHFWWGSAVTLVEERVYFQDPSRWTKHGVARFRYVSATKRWVLYYPDQHGRFHIYSRAKPSRAIQTLLDEVSRDPTGIFGG